MGPFEPDLRFGFIPVQRVRLGQAGKEGESAATTADKRKKEIGNRKEGNRGPGRASADETIGARISRFP